MDTKQLQWPIAQSLLITTHGITPILQLLALPCLHLRNQLGRSLIHWMLNMFLLFLEVGVCDLGNKCIISKFTQSPFIYFSGLVGYPSDDINKFLWMVRIGGGVFPHIKEPDYLVSS